MKIVIPDPIDLTNEGLSKISELPTTTVFADLPKDDAAIVERIQGAEIITANYIDITPAIIDASPSLKYIIAPAVGYEWIDHAYAKTKGIMVLNCPTFLANTVAELAIGLLLSVARQISNANVKLREGVWNPALYPGVELRGRSLGLMGYGNVGKRIEPIAMALGMNVLHINSKSSIEEIDELIGTSDVLIMCMPLNAGSENLLNAERIGKMKQTAVLINVGRGATVDQDALLEALEKKKIAGAGLDVFANEPVGNVPTEQILKLVRLENVVATPHYARNTAEAHERLGEELYANILACIESSPTNLVNP